MKNHWIFLAILSALVLAACGSASATPVDSKSGEVPLLSTLVPVAESPDPPLASPTRELISTEGDATQMNPFLLTPSASGLESLIEKAKEDLAQRLGISVDSVMVVAVIGQEFSTDAFYCRTSKERIAKEEPPLVVSGQSILLRAVGRQYEYHASDQMVVFCRPLP